MRDVVQEADAPSGQVYRVNAVQGFGSGCKIEPCRAQSLGHFGEIHAIPIAIEILMREVVATLATDLLQPFGNAWHSLGPTRAGSQHRPAETQCSVDPLRNVRWSGRVAVMQREQLTQRIGRSTPGKDIITDIK